MSEKKSSKEIQEILRTKKKHLQRLKGYPNVSGVGVGFKVTDGKLTEKIC